MDLERWIINFVVILVVAAVLVFIGLWKRVQYDKQAERCIKVVLRMPTGHDVAHIKSIGDIYKKKDSSGQSSEWIDVAQGSYKLDTGNKRWHKYPSRPFLGLSVLQTNIRTSVHDWGNPNGLVAPRGSDTIYAEERDEEGNLILKYPSVTSQEIYAYANNIQATKLVAEQQELIESNNLVKKTFANQPNKWTVYILLILLIIINVAAVIIVAQLGGII